MSMSSNQKNPPNDPQKYVRSNEHAKIKTIVDELQKESGQQYDLSPESLQNLTLQVAKRLANEHKWYKTIFETQNPTKNTLYNSLHDHLKRKLLGEQGGPHANDNENLNEVSHNSQKEVTNVEEDQHQLETSDKVDIKLNSKQA